MHGSPLRTHGGELRCFAEPLRPPQPWQPRSLIDGQPPTALCPAGLEHPAAIAGSHAFHKPMGAEPWNPLGLIRSFHLSAARNLVVLRAAPP